jgi:tol-pal system protein YbgF
MKNPLVTLLLGTFTVTFGSAVSAAGSIEERILRLERMADNPVMLQMSQRLAQQQRDIQRLQDELDRMKHEQVRLLEDGRGRYAETDRRLSDIEKTLQTLEDRPVQQGSVIASSAAAVAGSTPSAIQTRPATEAERLAYQKAFALMRAAKYQDSVVAFEAFIKSTPESDLASNASYWAGEGYLILKEDAKALASFERVLSNYPNSSKVADSLLRAGDALRTLGREGEAKQKYQRLIEVFPQSNAAQSAKKRLSATP